MAGAHTQTEVLIVGAGFSGLGAGFSGLGASMMLDAEGRLTAFELNDWSFEPPRPAPEPAAEPAAVAVQRG